MVAIKPCYIPFITVDDPFKPKEKGIDKLNKVELNKSVKALNKGLVVLTYLQ